MRKTVVALVVGLLFFAESDIMLWQRIFEGHDLFQFDMQYQTGHFTTLVAMIAVGVILLWPSVWAIWYGLAFYTLTFSGLEDALYYWLDGRQIPTALPWLNDYHNLILIHPVTNITLVLSSVIWIMIWAFSLVVISSVQRARASKLA